MRVAASSGMAITKILVAVDFSEGSRAALEEAIEIATKFGATIDILHAWQLPLRGGGDMMGGMSFSYADDIERLASEDLTRWRNRLHARGFADAKAFLVMSDPATAVLEHCKGGYDLIVVGTHGRTGIARWALGSIAEKIVRYAPCPVLTVRETAAQRTAAARL